jgi:hypothetical protein
MPEEEIELITLQAFRMEYPEFSEIPDEIIQGTLTKTTRLISEDYWRNYYLDAVFLSTAHEIFLRQQEAVLSQTQAAAIRDNPTFQSLNLNSSSDYYSTSNYGLSLLALKKRLPKSGFTL